MSKMSDFSEYIIHIIIMFSVGFILGMCFAYVILKYLNG